MASDQRPRGADARTTRARRSQDKFRASGRSFPDGEAKCREGMYLGDPAGFARGHRSGRTGGACRKMWPGAGKKLPPGSSLSLG